MSTQIEHILGAWPLDSLTGKHNASTPNSILESCTYKNMSSSHYSSTYYVSQENQTFIVKLLNNNASSGERELFHHGVQTQANVARELTLTPPIKYYDKQQAVCIMPFIAHTPIAQLSSEQRDSVLKTIAEKLHISHTATKPDVPFKLNLEHIQHYAQTIKIKIEKSLSINKVSVFDDFMQTIQIPVVAFDACKLERVLCHNDLNANNILVDTPNNNVSFIDWEFAALNNPYIDIASIAYYLKLSNKEIRQFCDTYLSFSAVTGNTDYLDNDKSHRDMFQLALITVISLDILWALFIAENPQYKWLEQQEKIEYLRKLCHFANQENVLL